MNNAFCGAKETDGNGNGKLEYILDIYPNSIRLRGEGYDKTFTKQECGTNFSKLKKLSNVLYNVQRSGKVWDGPNSLRDGMGYFRDNANDIKDAIKNVTGKTMPFTGFRDSSEITSTVNTKNGVHARIYFIKGGFSQARIIFKAEEYFANEVKLSFKKEDFNNHALKNAKIKITAVDNVEDIDGLSSNEKLISNDNGSFGTITVYPDDISKNTFKIKLEETDVPKGYKGLPEPVIFTVTYDPATGAVEKIEPDYANNLVKPEKANYIKINGNDVTITVKDKPKIEKLILLKQDSLRGTNLAGAEFTVTLENVESIGRYSTGGTQSGKIILTGIKTGSDGKLVIEDLVIADESQDVKITIEETGVPPTDGTYEYKKINGKIYITLKREGNKYVTKTGTKDSTVSDKEYDGNLTVNESKHEVSLTLKDVPVITLSGSVWLDGQTGEKDAETPNGWRDYAYVGSGKGNYVRNSDGEYHGVGDGKGDFVKLDAEARIENVLVKLYNTQTNKEEQERRTDSQGKYEFKDIEQLPGNYGYEIRFYYDGVNYYTVKKLPSNNAGESTATEVTRDALNNRLKTITKNTATSNDSKTNTKLLYTENNNKSTLQVNIDGTNPANVINKVAQPDFQVRADTDKFNVTRKDLHCGLIKKELDLGTVMTVDSTTLKINDKTTKYDYRKTLGDNLKDLDVDNLIQEVREDTVTTYLETSDYYYRIEDYKGIMEDYKGIDEEKTRQEATDIYNAADKLKELKVFVTYKVDLINQTINNGVTVNELAYYYDKNYTLVGIGKTVDGTTGQAINDTSLTRTPISDAFGKSAIKVSNINATSSDKSVIQSLYFTFEVNKTNNSLPQAITNPEGLNCANIVEITSYSTNNSLVDRDSAPGNLVDGRTNEDDTSQSNGLKIVLKGTDRTIKGTVFEDTNKDGILDNNDTKVDNVIVQLIEIRPKASGGLGEYIWQQTVSGSNKVKMTTKNGYEGVEYPNSVQAESGEYEFKGFIPGNYIIRYIYGDGTTYDFDQDGKIAKYNGQDYKSTKDPNYKAEMFNTARYAENSSVARDNEARRLEVMAYSTMIDNKIGEALDVLDKDISGLSETERNILNAYYDSLNKDDPEVKYALGLLKTFTRQPDITFDNISDENKYKLIKYYVSNKTWMAAETSTINVPVDSTTTSINANSTAVGLDYGMSKVTFENMNFGLALRPQTNIVLEKHITGLKITPNGTGVQSIVDAKADIKEIVESGSVNPQGVTQGLAAIKSTRGNRGFWQVATDVEELAQGAELEVEYTYVVRNDSEPDYLSSYLVDEYEGSVDGYATSLRTKAGEVKINTKGHTNSYGTYLGDFYYTGTVPAENDTNQRAVLSRVEAKGLEEALNNDLTFDATEEKTSGEDFVKINESAVDKNKYKENSDVSTEKIQTVIRNEKETEFLASNEKDYSKTVTLRTVLSSSTGGELGANIPSYIAEVVKYSNAAGRSDMTAEPENLSYVHSDDSEMTMENSNQHDEFWGESIIITKPTGEDKITPIQIAIITVSSMAVLGAGIVLIKKFVLKK